MNRWSMKDFENNEKNLYDIVIIDMSHYTFVQTYIMYKNQLAMQETWGLIPRSGRFPWRRAWQPTPVFLLGEFHGQRSLLGYKESVDGITKSQTQLSDLTHTYNVQPPK